MEQSRMMMSQAVKQLSHFRSCSTFLATTLEKEMSSERKPVWQLRVKWGGKSKSHWSCVRVCGDCRSFRLTSPGVFPPSPHCFPTAHLLQYRPRPLLPWEGNKLLTLSQVQQARISDGAFISPSTVGGGNRLRGRVVQVFSSRIYRKRTNLISSLFVAWKDWNRTLKTC